MLVSLDFSLPIAFANLVSFAFSSAISMTTIYIVPDLFLLLLELPIPVREVASVATETIFAFIIIDALVECRPRF